MRKKNLICKHRVARCGPDPYDLLWYLFSDVTFFDQIQTFYIFMSMTAFNLKIPQMFFIEKDNIWSSRAMPIMSDWILIHSFFVMMCNILQDFLMEDKINLIIQRLPDVSQQSEQNSSDMFSHKTKASWDSYSQGNMCCTSTTEKNVTEQSA